MHLTHTDDETDQGTRSSRGRIRLFVLLALLAIFLLIAFVPPLFNMSRFQQRIARNISAALGRPVHFDHVSLTLLPMPGFTLENFVVDEDPAFGFEPILRAGEVRVTLRISSLWRRHVEFSKISLGAGETGVSPSVNLVHASNGAWNIESLLLRASQLQAAPTDQRFAGPDRRFPYIEATNARLNLKLDQEKTPFSLTEADFALWLPEPHQWHLRLEARPIRTDTNSGDTGTLRVEGTMGGADLNATSLAQIPIDLHGSWHDAQLGGLSQLVLGNDSGLRGDVSVSFGILGTVGHNAITTDIQLTKARRADFVPDHLISLEAACGAASGETFRSFTSIECHWPPADSSDRGILILTADLPDVSNPDSGSANITFPALPARTFFDWLSVATPHPPTGFSGTGTLAGKLAWHPSAETGSLSSQLNWEGELEFSGESLSLPALGPEKISLGDVLVRSTQQPEQPSPRAHPVVAQAAGNGGFDLLPITLDLGGKQPATLEGHFDANGYTLHLIGNAIPARVLALGDAVPQFGDGLHEVLDPDPVPVAADPPTAPAGNGRGRGRAPVESVPATPVAEDPAPVHLDLTATRAWGGTQVWRETAQPAAHTSPRKLSRREPSATTQTAGQ
ncbi:MAG TPA: AsmA family protein [Acidobacteriaceae bacterium]|jgi:AsmA protein